jgi:hypothetical protein
MKTKIFLGAIVFCILSVTSLCQPPVPARLPDKPILFGNLPEQLSIPAITIQKIFAGSSTGFIRIPAEEYGYLEGYIIEKVSKSSSVITINIRLTNYDQALFTISRIIGKDQKENFIGRIVHRNYSDVLLLIQENEKIYLRKEKQSLFLVE